MITILSLILHWSPVTAANHFRSSFVSGSKTGVDLSFHVPLFRLLSLSSPPLTRSIVLSIALKLLRVFHFFLFRLLCLIYFLPFSDEADFFCFHILSLFSFLWRASGSMINNATFSPPSTRSKSCNAITDRQGQLSTDCWTTHSQVYTDGRNTTGHPSHEQARHLSSPLYIFALRQSKLRSFRFRPVLQLRPSCPTQETSGQTTRTSGRQCPVSVALLPTHSCPSMGC